MRTFTLCDAMGNPTHSLCRGHVSATAFRRAFEAEGWSGEVGDVTHEWWARKIVSNEFGHPRERWEKTEKDGNGALPMTVLEW